MPAPFEIDTFEQLLDLHNLYRLRVVNEDTLVHYRLQWCLTIEAGLSVFFAAVLSSAIALPFVLKSMLVVLIALTAIAVAAVALVAMRAAFLEIDRLSLLYERNVLPLFNTYPSPLPGLKGDEPHHWAGKLYPFMLPLIAILAWTLVVLIAVVVSIYELTPHR
jgi:hypothetical protein